MTKQTANTRSIFVEPDSSLITVDGQPGQVEPLLMRMLLHFYHHQGQLVTRQDLIEQVWCSNYVSDEAINITLFRLRKALGGKHDELIKTLPKKGFQFKLCEQVDFKLGAKQDQASGLTPQTPDKNPGRISKYALISLAVLLLIGMVMLLSNDAQTPIESANPELPLVIELAPIQFSSGNNAKNNAANQAAKNHQQSIIGLLKSQLGAHKQLKFDTSIDSHYSINITIKNLGINNTSPALRLSVSIDNHQGNAHFSDFEFAADALNNQIKAVVNEIAAYIRLMLLSKAQDKSLLKAHDPLKFVDIEQLIEVRQYATWGSHETLAYAYDLVTKLNQKYPNMPQITGLHSRLNNLRVVYSSVDIVEEKRQQLSKAKATLALEPSNFDALLTAFSFHRDFAPLRDKASNYAKALVDHYPNNARGWRSQLLLMIDNMMPCDKIAAYVERIKPGVFKKERLAVIELILNSCINPLPGQSIYDQLSFVPGNKRDKAILNNLMFFQVRYDSIWLADSRASKVFNGPKYDTVYFLYQLKRQDRLNAMVYLQKIKASENQYWHWFAQLYLTLQEPNNTQAPSEEQNLWRNDYFELLQKNAEMYFAAVHVRNRANNPASAQRIAQYLDQSQPFPINIMNRMESIARIMILHHVGREEEAQNIANLLYRQLEQNFQTSPNSFHFWHLGRYHLIAKLYCTRACVGAEQTPQQYLKQMFGPHHSWWQDDLKLMEQALKPWSNNPLVEQYLQRVKTDLARMQQLLGITVE